MIDNYLKFDVEGNMFFLFGNKFTSVDNLVSVATDMLTKET